ncbi:MAG: hypothetical protein HY225_03965 [Candidatus Vogelbacteria bacterium]|nr:hypothetical protein [Candidatus Vogelbacteria bacterium]
MFQILYYRCEGCGQLFADDEDKKCRQCESSHLAEVYELTDYLHEKLCERSHGDARNDCQYKPNFPIDRQLMEPKWFGLSQGIAATARVNDIPIKKLLTVLLQNTKNAS